jgi:hypothetical protein
MKKGAIGLLLLNHAEQLNRASTIAGPETKVMGDSLCHTILRHLERHDMNRVLLVEE